MSFLDASKVDENLDSGLLPQGKMYHIACKSWTTSNGVTLPLSMKFIGDDGDHLIYVPEIKVNYTEEKCYSGIMSREFDCEAVFGGLLRKFKLILYCEVCKWVMLVPD